MILSGWKEIADYMRCGMRTAQRWEEAGLPVRRPYPGQRRRSHVVAQSEDIDGWCRHSAAFRSRNGNLLTLLEQTSKLRIQISRAREQLQLKLEDLRKQVETVVSAAEQLRRDSQLRKRGRLPVEGSGSDRNPLKEGKAQNEHVGEARAAHGGQ